MNRTSDIAPAAGDEDAEVLKAVAGLPLLQPPTHLVASFRQRLEARPLRRRGLSLLLVTGIAAMLVLASGAGWWHERQLRLGESHTLQSKLDIAMQSLSAATRLQAIQAAVVDGSHGDAVEQALVTALLTDPNTSVRMAAAEALGRIARPGALGSAVRRALATENSPFVQLKILEAADRLPEAERRAVVTPILSREHIDAMVLSDARSRLVEQSQGDPR